MPQIQTTIADVKVHAHTFRFISSALTEKYKVPNPCNTCHTEKSTAWSAEALSHWAGFSPWRVE
jgi:hypothetical protein